MTLSDAARAIADRPAFPVKVPGDPGAFYVTAGSGSPATQHAGMTYHQWLVGQALAGLDGPNASAVAYALRRADAVCEALAEREAQA